MIYGLRQGRPAFLASVTNAAEAETALAGARAGAGAGAGEAREVRMTHLEDMALEDELAESNDSRLHCVRATTETPVQIGDVQEPVVALVDHGLEINLMSMDFYKKGKWSINTKHG